MNQNNLKKIASVCFQLKTKDCLQIWWCSIVTLLLNHMRTHFSRKVENKQQSEEKKQEVQ